MVLILKLKLNLSVKVKKKWLRLDNEGNSTTNNWNPNIRSKQTVTV